MTRIMGLALLALVAATQSGGNDGTGSYRGNVLQVEVPGLRDDGARTLPEQEVRDGEWQLQVAQGRDRSADVHVLRIQSLASDGIATPEPVATATAVPEPTQDAPVYGAGVEQWRSLVASVFPAWAVNTVLRIMDCESEGDPNATGAAGERGLMQIALVHYDSTFDPLGNLLAAYRISNGGTDWSAWSCR